MIGNPLNTPIPITNWNDSKFFRLIFPSFSTSNGFIHQPNTRITTPLLIAIWVNQWSQIKP